MEKEKKQYWVQLLLFEDVFVTQTPKKKTTTMFVAANNHKKHIVIRPLQHKIENQKQGQPAFIEQKINQLLFIKTQLLQLKQQLFL